MASIKTISKILIIIPAYNEAGCIEKVVDNLEKKYPQYDYVVINDAPPMTPVRYVPAAVIISWIFL